MTGMLQPLPPRAGIIKPLSGTEAKIRKCLFSKKLNIAIVGKELGTLSGFVSPKFEIPSWETQLKQFKINGKKTPSRTPKAPYSVGLRRQAPNASSRVIHRTPRPISRAGSPRTSSPRHRAARPGSARACDVLRDTARSPVQADNSKSTYQSLIRISEKYDTLSHSINDNVVDLETLFRTIIIQPACVNAETFKEHFSGVHEMMAVLKGNLEHREHLLATSVRSISDQHLANDEKHKDIVAQLLTDHTEEKNKAIAAARAEQDSQLEAAMAAKEAEFKKALAAKEAEFKAEYAEQLSKQKQDFDAQFVKQKQEFDAQFVKQRQDLEAQHSITMKEAEARHSTKTRWAVAEAVKAKERAYTAVLEAQQHAGTLAEVAAVAMTDAERAVELVAGSVRTVQRYYRGSLGRKAVRALRFEKMQLFAGSALTIQRLYRGNLGRQTLRAIKLEKLSKTGEMLPMPGTEQNASGWYEHGNGVFRFVVDAQGEWQYQEGPLSVDEWRKRTSQERRQSIQAEAEAQNKVES